jgi:hypothetical protein
VVLRAVDGATGTGEATGVFPVPVSARVPTPGGPWEHGIVREVPPTATTGTPAPLEPDISPTPTDATLGPGPTGHGLDRRRGAAQLTEAERVQRRRNRRWLTVIGIPALIVGALSLIASVIAGRSSPSVHPRAVPPGYQAVSSDGVFAYAVPSGWTTNSAYSDDVGDLDTQGNTGWVAEHLGVRSTAPVAGESPPSSFTAFGEPQPRPYHLSPAQPTTVPGTTVAFRYQMTRPGGFVATAIDAWQAGSGSELWLLIDAPAPTTETILASLNS